MALDSDRFAGDRINLGGLRFTGLTVADLNGDGGLDSRLSYDGGMLVVLYVGDLTLDEWNGLVV